MTDVPSAIGATLIGVLVDRSGSMAECLAGSQEGLNAFIREQASRPGGADVTLAQFDHVFEEVWPLMPIEKAPQYYLMPRGGTALHDAIGEFISSIGEQLASDPTYRPVVIAILTDGDENSSKEWTKDTVRAQIAYWREYYGWRFIFLGANIDAVFEGEKLGIPKELAMTYDTRSAKQTYSLLSKVVTDIRAGNDAEFTEQDRRKALGQ
jgi:uncharacterized protein YegL